MAKRKRYEPELLIDGVKGIYIPQAFAESVQQPKYLKMWHLKHDKNFQSLLNGPDDEYYWDAWDVVMTKAWCYYPGTRKQYYLGYGEGGGDLFAIPEGYEF